LVWMVSKGEKGGHSEAETRKVESLGGRKQEAREEREKDNPPD